MPQTVNGQNASENKEDKSQNNERPVIARSPRPGQRQQERLQRIARRRKRQRITAATIVAVVIVIAGITGAIMYNNYNAQQEAIRTHATATANAHATGTSQAYANATATTTAKNCFVSPSGEAVPAIYSSDKAPTSGPATAPALKGTPVNAKNGVKYVDIKVGTGATVTEGKTITANYTGWIASTCQKFDSSYDSHSGQAAAPLSIQLATGSIIPGWIDGLAGMKVGGIRRIYIPAAEGYGDQAQGSIPANSDLIFDVQLISFK